MPTIFPESDKKLFAFHKRVGYRHIQSLFTDGYRIPEIEGGKGKYQQCLSAFQWAAGDPLAGEKRAMGLR